MVWGGGRERERMCVSMSVCVCVHEHEGFICQSTFFQSISVYFHLHSVTVPYLVRVVHPCGEVTVNI